MATGTLPKRTKIADSRAWKGALASSRPVLSHLNADTSWLLQLPVPASARAAGGRPTFNILIDPWLQGPQSDVASWFSTQWHVVAPSVRTMAELDSALAALQKAGAPHSANEEANSQSGASSHIDVVVISHEFTDHCHKATLKELPRGTPVFATEKAAGLIRSWKHFDHVLTTPGFPGSGKSWKDCLGGSSWVLPPWLGIGRVVTPGNALYYHSAIMIAFDLGIPVDGSGSSAEAIVYSPHGIKGSDLECVASLGLKTLALLHGLHDVQIWKTKQLNLGGLNGIDAARASGATYWIATHDEVKKGGGLVSYFLRRRVYSPNEAAERQTRNSPTSELGYEFVELGSGEMIVLETKPSR